MIPQERDIFCIIVHFGAKEPTDKLVRGLAVGDVVPRHIIIVDHSDQPYQSNARISMHVVRETGNRGYAAGVNTGLAAAVKLGARPQSIIIVCNNDVSVEPYTLASLQEWWRDRRQPLLAAHRIGYVNLITGRAHITPIGAANTPFAVAYAHGSYLVASYGTWQMIGQLPERYFLYWEDVAASMRAHAAGVSLRQLPAIGIQHNDARAPISSKKRYLLVRNGADLLETLTPDAWPLYWAGANKLRLAYHRMRGDRLVAQALRDRKHL